MSKVLIGSAAIAVTAACIYAAASAPATAETVNVDTNLDGVTTLATSSGIDVIYEVSDVYTIDIDVSRGDPDELRIEREGNTLRIGRERSGGWNWGMNNNQLRAKVTVLGPNLSFVDASSGSSAKVSGLEADTMRLEASSGADVDVAGTCATLVADASSGADIDAREMACVDGRLEASSGADVDAYITGSVDIDVSSGADARVIGGATIGNAEKSSGADYSVG
ncbi:MAG: DUF2807 domain-containing protein [Pseudomonadota bacterium]